MQIVGSFTPNSAAAERVFSLLKLMFGDAQMSALADMIQASLMLKYNKRKVGCREQRETRDTKGGLRAERGAGTIAR